MKARELHLRRCKLSGLHVRWTASIQKSYQYPASHPGMHFWRELHPVRSGSKSQIVGQFPRSARPRGGRTPWPLAYAEA
eukprot:6344031-Ditylum_brightwellii.AAC.1